MQEETKRKKELLTERKENKNVKDRNEMIGSLEVQIEGWFMSQVEGKNSKVSCIKYCIPVSKISPIVCTQLLCFTGLLHMCSSSRGSFLLRTSLGCHSDYSETAFFLRAAEILQLDQELLKSSHLSGSCNFHFLYLLTDVILQMQITSQFYCKCDRHQPGSLICYIWVGFTNWELWVGRKVDLTNPKRRNLHNSFFFHWLLRQLSS